jgi:hypothetical protein
MEGLAEVLEDPLIREISVGDPMKVGGSFSSYTTYKVTTVYPNGERANQEVNRRFSDFEWFDSIISKNQGKYGATLPTLPGKQWGGRFEENFINERKRGLERFLTASAEVPFIDANEAFDIFLGEWDDKKFDNIKKGAFFGICRF